jgi:hypothetical protein
LRNSAQFNANRDRRGFVGKVPFVIKPTITETTNIELDISYCENSPVRYAIGATVQDVIVGFSNSFKVFLASTLFLPTTLPWPILEFIEPAYSNIINFINIQSGAIPSIEMAIKGIGKLIPGGISSPIPGDIDMPIPGGIDTPIGGGIDMSTPISIIL